MSEALLFHVDAFTPLPFAGNPAMVCLLPDSKELSVRWMQSLAVDINLSETAFVRPLVENSEADFELRWFTPMSEVDLCGHATLASAHTLFKKDTSRKMVRFRTLSGILTVSRGDNDTMWMDFPKREAMPFKDTDALASLSAALGAEVSNLGKTASGDLFATIGGETELREITPDFKAIAALPNHRGIMITANSAGEADFVSRFFAPNEGIDEDPVTGSAHCALAPFWAAKLGRNELTGYQCSRRGGTVQCRVESDRVHLGGQAVTIYSGKISLD